MWEIIFEKANIWHFVFLFVAVSLPGLVSMHVYRLLFAHHDIDWKTAFQESIFWGALNLAIVGPPLYMVLSCLPSECECSIFLFLYWFLCWVGLCCFIFVFPALLPWVWSKMLRWEVTRKFVPNFPCPTAWDWFFGVRNDETCFVLIHLKNGEKIAGYFGLKSYATSFPRNGDIYLEKTIKVDENGVFQHVVENTLGLIITRDEYSYVELFAEVPKREEQHDTQ